MSLRSFQITAHVVDVVGRRTYPARVEVVDGRITRIEPLDASEPPGTYLLPGFIDAHVHIESSMLVPREFARAAVVHGTVGVVTDPHEIGNVLGVEGVHYMLADAEGVPFHFHFGAPSCVPATAFETAGDRIDVAGVTRLLDDPRIGYLSEMMNFPGVLGRDPEVIAKIEAARARGKPVDGHAPGLRGDDARRYFAAGITTDHECFTIEEAREKLDYGCKISIREGSAARNFEALWPLLSEAPGRVMLCSDDKHPDELAGGHIDQLVRRAVAHGVDLYDALLAACVVPVEHYGLDVGLLREGDPADFIEVDGTESLGVLRTWVGGELVAERGTTHIERVPPPHVNRFAASPVPTDAFRVEAAGPRLHVIEALDGQLITNRDTVEARIENGAAVADPSSDLLKIAVVNRYADAPPAVAFVRGFGLQRGAIAGSVAHDSHNVIGVGTTDGELAAAVNLVIESRGGLAVAAGDRRESLPLPIAGLISDGTCGDVAATYARLDRMSKDLGATLRAPFMTLSFMALLVIPEIKLSDRGLFDAAKFEFLPLFA